MSRVIRRGPPDARKKLVIVGDGSCGKTCLLIVFSTNIFPEKYIPTVFENYIADVEYDGKRIELALWDTAGQEDYDRLRPLSYPETDVMLIAFSVDSPLSLKNVKDRWYPEVAHFCNDVPIILVGLKTDLRYDPEVNTDLAMFGQKPVTPDQGEAMARQINAKKYMECSSKTRQGVDDIFEAATKLAMSNSLQRLRKKMCVLL
ncbi:GTP-binding protein Rho1 [Dispira parvispora]|uniref:GTP-binding protein Rho1 n=1 Tax=Dispira parvispora TaxID=1520584 RepID=A0A9W8ANI1_9FUNG|nr:GTP-binding protein Rho1 [Dispira simplex]KAJ1657136.1 GTP-binding protein Rho1 [Dispira simplex]KAJ1948337.1 GTP-binding protein Rho1 [Dispira parvispora]